jgi:integrase
MGFTNSKKYDGIQLYHKANKDISYYIRFRDENNKLKRIKIGDKSQGITEAFCNQKRIEILNNVRLGEESPILARKKKKKVITLNQVADIYFEQREAHTKNNIKSRQKYTKKLEVKFGHKDIDEITTDKILLYQIELKKSGLAPATINYILTFLGTLFNIAIEENLYKKQNPLQSKKIKKLKTDNQRERYLTKKEINSLYDNLEDETLKLFVELALSTGGRLETILNIKVKDINIENKVITLKDLKSDSTYIGFISSDLANYLKKLIEKLPMNSFVIGGKITKTPSRTISRKIKIVMDRLFNQGLDTKDSKNRVVIHTLRHTFASHLAINGTPIFTIQKLMNHRDINMTLRYAKLSPDSGRDFVEKLYI